jgi:histidine triad (HIT) family protein
MAQADCVFCKIVAGQIPSARVYEDDVCLAFLDIGPLAEAHLLLVPKGHYEWITDMPSGQLEAVCRQIPSLARAVMKVTGAQGFNVLQNNGQVSGQAVPHVHFHIIPRREGDGLGYRWNAGKYPEGRVQALRQALVEAMKA